MALERNFFWSRIQFDGYGWQDGWSRFDEQVLASAGLERWGAWYGLFGLRANELIVLTHGPRGADQLAVAERAVPGRVVEHYEFAPTVRPTTTATVSKPGLYVFRFFDTVAEHVEEIAQLSNTAWNTFESSDAYATEPQALFAPTAANGPGRMLLLTWYDGFDSWVTSRQPAPEARENFQRRRALTSGTIAYATRLVGT